LGLALDEPTETDEVIETGGFTYIVEKSLLKQAQPIRIDYVANAMGEGFIITSGMTKKGDCGGCTSC
jgi:Fe-S cluster assembly iron-binding protein IscA